MAIESEPDVDVLDDNEDETQLINCHGCKGWVIGTWNKETGWYECEIHPSWSDYWNH